MQFIETGLLGAVVIDLEPKPDERGFFARVFCRHEFEDHGLDPCVAQCNIAFTHLRGTIRGMHYAAVPHAEAKLVRCTSGAIWDAIVDLRPDSPTHLRWTAAELSAENRRALYVPKGFGHGYQTLRGETEVLYQMSESYAPAAARGFHYNDRRFRISWPERVTAVSERDAALGEFDPERFDG